MPLMCKAHSLPRQRGAFTLIELLVVMVLILVIAAVGLGYIVFGQDNQHSVNGAQALTGALFNARQLAHRDQVPTGVRLLFGPTAQSPTIAPTQASQLQLIQQPSNYQDGTIISVGSTAPFTATFSGTDFFGGTGGASESYQWAVQPGDYLLINGTGIVHQITGVNSATSLTLASTATLSPGQTYSIIRAPRPLPSQDLIQMPNNLVIENGVIPGNSPSTFSLNLPGIRTVGVTQSGATISGMDIVFAPMGGVVTQGLGSDKIILWLREVGPKFPNAVSGAPVVVSIGIRTGFVAVFPVAPWTFGTPITTGTAGSDPYLFVTDPRSSGL
jgi:prepilin-type N-terminal cleavage/methylation domain-containing protein